jgi:hypothetical protein
MMGREGFENITLAFRELSWMGAHFRPFTKVLRKFRREVTRKTGKSLNRESAEITYAQKGRTRPTDIQGNHR